MNESDNCSRCNASLERGCTTIYKEGKPTVQICFDCDRKEIFQIYLENKRLRTRLVTDNSLVLYDFLYPHHEPRHLGHDKLYDLKLLDELSIRLEIQKSNIRISEKIKEFEREVWYKGLQKTIRASKTKGVSAKLKVFDNFCVLTYTMCGRTMITIENDHNSVTAITLEDEPGEHMGMQGVDATEKEALSLIQLAIELYHNKGGTHLVFKDDDKVGMF